jgi:hypothetical protein
MTLLKETHGEKLCLELDYNQKETLKEATDEYHKAVGLVMKDYTLLDEKKLADDLMVFKAFVFSQTISAYSSMHRIAFDILRGEELECYLKDFIKEWGKWIDNPDSEPELSIKDGRNVPRSVLNLIRNEDFILTHIEPFLSSSHVNVHTKENLISRSVIVRQSMKSKNFRFNKEETLLAIDISNQYSLNISPFIPSIRHIFNLDNNLPDSWVKEIYCS